MVLFNIVLPLININKKIEIRQLLKSNTYYGKNYSTYSSNIFPEDRDVCFDKIVEISEISEILHPYVYDFETESTKNFSIANGLIILDSFHKAGLAEKLVVSGVSKFSELLRRINGKY